MYRDDSPKSRKLLTTVIVLILLAVVLAAAFIELPAIMNGRIVDWINVQFPPRSTAQAQASAIAASYTGLNAISAPNLAVSVSSQTLTPLLAASLAEASRSTPMHLDNVEVKLADQQFAYTSSFADDLVDQDVSISGRAEGYVAVSAQAGQIVLTPTLDRVQVDRLTANGLSLPTSIARSIGDALTAVIANINGRIKPFALDTAKPMLTENTFGIAGAQFVTPSEFIVGQSVLVDENRMVWLGQIGPTAVVSPAAGEGVDYQTFKKAFIDKGQALLAQLPADGVAVGQGLSEALFREVGPKTSKETSADTSMQAAWRSANQLVGPDLGIVLPADEIRGIVLPLLQQAISDAASKNDITLQDTDFSLSNGLATLSLTAKAAVSSPIKGNIQFRLAVSAAPTTDGSRLALLPSLDAQVIGVQAEALQFSALITSINTILKSLSSGLSDRLPSIPIDIKPFNFGEVNLDEIAKATPGLQLSPSVIPAPEMRIDRSALLITPSGIQVLADLSTASSSLAERPVGPDPAPYPGEPESVERLFAQRRSDRLGEASPDKISADVSWTRLAEMVNASWKDVGGIRATYNFDTGNEDLGDVAIELVQKPSYTCSMGRACGFHSCADECVRDACDWGCDNGICTEVPCPTWSQPLRTCQKCTGNPVCEANKAACQAAREPKYQACRLACDTKANTDKAACDVQANLEKSGCDVGRAIQDAASHVGGIGRIGGVARAYGVVRTDAAALALTTDHPGAIFAPQTSADIHIDGALDFVPYDVGHLLVCPAKGKAPFATEATLPLQRPAIDVALSAADPPPAASPTEKLQLNLAISSFDVVAKVVPAPADAILTQNPQLLVECNPVLNAGIVGLSILGKAQGLSGADLIRAAAGKDVAAAFTGDIDYKVNGFTLPVSVNGMEFTIASQKIAVVPRLTERSVRFLLSH